MSGMVWRGLLLGLVFLVDFVVLMDLVRAEWRDLRVRRSRGHAPRLSLFKRATPLPG